jgi:hypothetical protein
MNETFNETRNIQIAYPADDSPEATWRSLILAVTPVSTRHVLDHWSKQHKLIEYWHNLLVLAGVEHIPDATGPRSIRVERHSLGYPAYASLWYPTDRLIFDNLVALGKLLDTSMRNLKEPQVIPVHSREKATVIFLRDWGARR